jgi:hypothetical protein
MSNFNRGNNPWSRSIKPRSASTVVCESMLGGVVSRNHRGAVYHGEKNTLSYILGSEMTGGYSEFLEGFGVVDTSVHYDARGSDMSRNPMACNSDNLWSRLCRPWGKGGLDSVIAEDTTQEMHYAGNRGYKYATSHITATDSRKRRVDGHKCDSIEVMSTDSETTLGAVAIEGQLFPWGRNNGSTMMRAVSSDNQKANQGYLSSNVNNVYGLMSDSPIAYLQFKLTPPTTKEELQYEGLVPCPSDYERDRYARMVFNRETGAILDFGLLCNTVEVWRTWREEIRSQVAEDSSNDDELTRKATLYSEDGILPEESEQPIPIIEKGLASGGILVVHSYGLHTRSGGDVLNISGWKIPDTTHKLMDMANDLMESEKFNEFTKSPESNVRALRVSKDGIRASLGVH